MDYSLKYGAAANIAGGTHHSFRNRGEGFCLFNDVATASLYALEKYQFNSILIIDLDVHQGNGTASILKDRPKYSLLVCMEKKIIPLKKRSPI